jgi:hypothetical protein
MYVLLFGALRRVLGVSVTATVRTKRETFSSVFTRIGRMGMHVYGHLQRTTSLSVILSMSRESHRIFRRAGWRRSFAWQCSIRPRIPDIVGHGTQSLLVYGYSFESARPAAAAAILYGMKRGG